MPPGAIPGGREKRQGRGAESGGVELEEALRNLLQGTASEGVGGGDPRSGAHARE
jgi:hypothetical protein